MKNQIYLLLILFALQSNSQNVVFSGTVFKNKLLLSSTTNAIAQGVNNTNIKIDANGNGNISVAEASAVYRLNVDNSLLPNLVGIESFKNITVLNASGNLFSKIDVSKLSSLQILGVANNFNLVSIYAKNNANETINFGISTPNLVYICQDEAFVIPDSSNTLPNYVMNSYGSIEPGGSYNAIKGKLIFDNDENGGTNDTNDYQPYMKVKCELDDNIVLYTTTDVLSNYCFFIPEEYQDTYTISPILEVANPGLFDAVSQANGTIITGVISGINQTYTHNLILTPGNFPRHDYEVVVMPIVLPVAGQQAIYDVVYKNKGAKKTSHNIKFKFVNSPFSSLVSINNGAIAIPLPNTDNFYEVAFTDLMPFEQRKFRIVVSIANTAAIGETIEINANVYNEDNSFLTADPNTIDNYFTLKQVIGATSGSNRFACLQESTLPTSEIGKYLHYEINLENIATANSNFAVVKAVFDPAKFNIESLQIMDSFIDNPTLPDQNDNLTLQIKGNEALFRLNNAMQGGEPGGQGGILFKIRTLDTLPIGSTVGDVTQLFFDYNYDLTTPPVAQTTNAATTTFQNLSIYVNTIDTSINIYPNPATTEINISSDNVLNTVMLYDICGRLLQTNVMSSLTSVLDVSQRASGTYFLKITSEKGQKVEKVIKN